MKEFHSDKPSKNVICMTESPGGKLWGCDAKSNHSSKPILYDFNSRIQEFNQIQLLWNNSLCVFWFLFLPKSRLVLNVHYLLKCLIFSYMLFGTHRRPVSPGTLQTGHALPDDVADTARHLRMPAVFRWACLSEVDFGGWACRPYETQSCSSQRSS